MSNTKTDLAQYAVRLPPPVAAVELRASIPLPAAASPPPPGVAPIELRPSVPIPVPGTPSMAAPTHQRLLGQGTPQRSQLAAPRGESIVLVGREELTGRARTKELADARAVAPPPPLRDNLGPRATELSPWGAHAELQRLGVSYTSIHDAQYPGVQVPVVLHFPLFGVKMQSTGGESRSLVMDVRLAAGVAHMAKQLGAWGVSEIWHLGAYHEKPGRHGFGLALDIAGVTANGRRYDLLEHWKMARSALPTHKGAFRAIIPTRGERQRMGHEELVLRQIWGYLLDEFRLAMGPSNNRDHHNHFHVALDEMVNPELMAGRPPARSLRELRSGWYAPVAQGAYGSVVRQVRRALQRSGYGWVSDGRAFDRNLAYAIRTFQTSRGLEPDGVVGPATAAALLGLPPL